MYPEVPDHRWLENSSYQVGYTFEPYHSYLTEANLLHFLSKVTRLEDLDIGFITSTTTDSTIKALGDLQHLTRLDMMGLQLTDSMVKLLFKPDTAFARLRRLNVIRTKISLSGVEAILDDCPNLEFLCEHSFSLLFRLPRLMSTGILHLVPVLLI